MKTIAIALEKPIVRGVGATLALTSLTAVLSQVAFHVPFTPVPVTLSVLAMVLSGLMLGSKRGAMAQVAYLSAGLAGAPIFAFGSFGPAALLGPSGGYLPGYVVGAFITGLIYERMKNKTLEGAFMACAMGVVGLYACGVAWLSVWIGPSEFGLRAWALGALPFIGVDAVKSAIASVMVTGINRCRR